MLEEWLRESLTGSKILFSSRGQIVEIRLHCFLNPLDGAAVTAIGWEPFKFFMFFFPLNHETNI